MSPIRDVLQKRGFLVGVIAFGLLLVAYSLLSRQSDEERVAVTLERLGQALSFESPPNVLMRAANLNGAFEELLVQNVLVKVPERGFSAQGRSELSTLTVQATATLQRFVVRLEPTRISVTGDRAEADVRVSVDAQSGSSDRGDDREATCTLVKQDGDWRLASCIVLEPEDE